MVCIREDFDYFCVFFFFLPQGNQIKGQRDIEIIRVFVGISMIFLFSVLQGKQVTGQNNIEKISQRGVAST